MFEVRFHGRGGQGTVTAAELLSAAAFTEGMHAQAFPSFGSERTGAPVMSFCRIDDAPIRSREPVTTAGRAGHPGPDAAASGERLRGRPGGLPLLINSARPAADLNIGEFTGGLRPGSVLTVPATELAHAAPGQAGAERGPARRVRRAHRPGQARLRGRGHRGAVRRHAQTSRRATREPPGRRSTTSRTSSPGSASRRRSRPLTTMAAGSPAARASPAARTARGWSRSRGRPGSPRPSRAAGPR